MTTPTPPRDLLTARQLEVLRLVANGHTRAAIGRRFGVGLGAVNKQLHGAYVVLGVRHEAHAVAVALALRLIHPDEIRVPGRGGRQARPRRAA